jgi:ABC-type polysaccharide/polyol phosphate export permease
MADYLRLRFLFEQMVRRELRQKGQRSALGVAWYVVNALVPIDANDAAAAPQQLVARV